MLEISYYGLSIIMLMLVLFFYYKSLENYYTEQQVIKQKMTSFLTGLGIYILYLFALSYTGLLTDFSFPPKLPLLLVVPFVSFLIYFYQKNKNNPFFYSIPLEWTTYPQSFRIFVELLLLYTFYRGVIPKTATFEGYNFDILMGVLAPFVAWFLVPKQEKNKILLKVWNVLGILMILFVAFIITSSIYRPQIWGGNTPLLKPEFLQLPYLLVPAFLAPLGIFMHVVSLIQLRK